MSTPPNGRFEALDALRGLAAMSVVLGHFTNVFPRQADLTPASPAADVVTRHAFDLLTLTPGYALIAAHEAVILFFLLSGFVLSLPWVRGRTVPYLPFLIKRVFRIYVPYLVMIALAVLLCATLSQGPIPELSEWFRRTWTDPVTVGNVVDHVLMLGQYDDTQYNTAIWSLIHELRISLVFPLLMLVFLRLGPIQNLALAAALSVAGKGGTYFMPETNLFLTLHYAGLFVVGALLARHLPVLLARRTALSPVARNLLLIAGVALYLYGGRTGPASDWVIAAGSVIIILSALGSVRFTQWLAQPWIAFLGRVSYSMYLMHSLVLFSLVHLLYGTVSLWLVFPAYVVLVLLISAASYRVVEEPAMRAGQQVAARRPMSASLRVR